MFELLFSFLQLLVLVFTSLLILPAWGILKIEKRKKGFKNSSDFLRALAVFVILLLLFISSIVLLGSTVVDLLQ